MALVEHSEHMELAHPVHDNPHGMPAEEHNQMLKFGWWVYIASEIMLFSSLIAAFVLAKRLDPDAGEVLNIPLTGFNTFLLLTSSWTVVRALASAQESDQKGVQRSLFMSIALGAIFVGIQMYEYTQLSHEGLTLHSDFYGGAFYILTGFHGTHVAVGVLWLIRNFILSLDNHFTHDNTIGLEILGLYWHFVDVVWIFLFTIIYLL